MEDIIDKFLSKIRQLSMKYKYIILLFLIISIGIYIFNYIRKDEDIKNIAQYYQENTNIQEEKQTVIIHIQGAVLNPGVYELEMDSRINDAINKAGGLTSDAMIESINLAKKINDGEKIYIYKEGEEIIQINENTQTATNGRININNATKEQLMSLPGIGEATANKILDYIQKNGKLKMIEDIKNINGIGNSKYESIKDLIDIK